MSEQPADFTDDPARIAAEVGVGAQWVLCRLIAALEARRLLRGADLASDLEEIAEFLRAGGEPLLTVSFVSGVADGLRKQAGAPARSSLSPARLRVVVGDE